MNHLLMTINADLKSLAKAPAQLHLISVDTDLFFPALEIKKAYEVLIQQENMVFYHEIKSIHGHDAFLMEYEQLNDILKPIFN